MEEIKGNIAKNIAILRTSSGLTQAQLAEALSYTDKAVSKWERGESVPDVFVLKQIADKFGVSVDYLLQNNGGVLPENPDDSVRKKHNRLVISLLAAGSVWLAATAAFVFPSLLPNPFSRLWVVFPAALPLSLIVLLVFNSIWGVKKRNYIIISLLIWSTLAAFYLGFLDYNPWLLFLLGVPAQALVVLWSRMNPRTGGCRRRK